MCSTLWTPTASQNNTKPCRLHRWRQGYQGQRRPSSSNFLPRPRNVAMPLRLIGQLYPTYLEPTEHARGHASSLSLKPPAHNCCFFFSHFLLSHQTDLNTPIALLLPLHSTTILSTAPSHPAYTTLYPNQPHHGQGGRRWCCRWHWTGTLLSTVPTFSLSDSS
jgi:hypothetical protein